MKWFFILVGILMGSAPAYANDRLATHFLGSGQPVCLEQNRPVVVVTDVSRRGEIDDSLALLLLARLEQQGCVRIIKIVSIFGNEGQTTEQSHRALLVRLSELGLSHWRSRVLQGPDHSVTSKQRTADLSHLRLIRQAIRRVGPVTMLELGPVTVSARLLLGGPFMPAHFIKRIIAVGGLRPEDSMPGLMRDLNVALDRDAMRHLIEHYSHKLSLVTYVTGMRRGGLFRTALLPRGFPGLHRQAVARGRSLSWLGYRSDRYPVWDPHAVSLLTRTRLNCSHRYARFDGDRLSLYRSSQMGKRVRVCL